jgi:ABC-type branched-subunit amino acid transport system substrate-binding protein
LVLFAAVDLIKNAQVQAIIGPPTSAEAEFVSHIGDRAHVPVLSYSATSPELSAAQTPFFVRTTANDSFQTAPVAAVLRAFNWRAAAVLYEDSPYGMGILPALADALQGVSAKIMDRASVPSDADDARIDAVLYRLMAMPTRVFVVHMLYPLAARVFRRAKKVGMMSEEYVWVATDGVGIVPLSASSASSVRSGRTIRASYALQTVASPPVSWKASGRPRASARQ